MFVYPIFWGCKYTNNFLFINKKAEFQHLKLLITSMGDPRQAPGLHQHRHKAIPSVHILPDFLTDGTLKRPNVALYGTVSQKNKRFFDRRSQSIHFIIHIATDS